MNLKAKKEKNDNYEKIYKIINLNRNLSLIEIHTLMRNLKTSYKNFKISKKIIDSVQEKMDKNFYFNKPTNLSENKTLWIYPNFPEKYTNNFYKEMENKILKEKQSDDFIITIGEKALTFAHENKINIIAHFKEQDDFNLILEQIVNIICFYLEKQIINKINFAIHSIKIKDFVANIYPLNNFDFNLDFSDQETESILESIQNFCYFPDMNIFLINQMKTYFFDVIKLLLLESRFIIYKNKLINENKLLKEVELKIFELKKNIIKTKREMDIEEMNLIGEKEEDDFIYE